MRTGENRRQGARQSNTRVSQRALSKVGVLLLVFTPQPTRSGLLKHCHAWAHGLILQTGLRMDEGHQRSRSSVMSLSRTS